MILSSKYNDLFVRSLKIYFCVPKHRPANTVVQRASAVDLQLFKRVVVSLKWWDSGKLAIDYFIIHEINAIHLNSYSTMDG